MGEIVLARVDERLIHGQVMTQLSKSAGANMIIVSDNEVATDDFMRKIFLSTGKRTGLKIKILTNAETINYWKEYRFDNNRVILIAKDVETFEELIDNDVSFKELNVGNISKKKDTFPIIKTVSVNEEQLTILNDLHQKYDVQVYFQAIPAGERLSLNSANKLVGI